MALMSLFLASILLAFLAVEGDLEPHRTYLVAVTDPHGFFSGHRHNEKYDADYASLSSFADRLREQAQGIEGCDVYFLENGDLVDGGGLTDELPGKELTFPILDDVGFDARTIGNHELYIAESMQTLKFPGVFVTSNIVDPLTRKPFGKRYRILPSKQGSVMVLGFLYNMRGYDNRGAYVETVQTSLGADWFKQAMAEPNIRSIIVLAHMDYKDPLVTVILNAIRANKPQDFPVVFITGHTHMRRSTKLDSHAFSFETGKFMDTVGVLSFPSSPAPDGRLFEFKHEYLDASKSVLFKYSGSHVETDKALDIRRRLREARVKLRLDRLVGFSMFTYRVFLPLEAPLSLVRFWVERVIPGKLLNKGTKCRGFFIGGSGSIRYDLLRGPVLVDDLWAVDPFKEGYRVVRCLAGEKILVLLSKLPRKMEELTMKGLQARGPLEGTLLPTFVHTKTATVEKEKTYDLVFGTYEAPVIMHYLNEMHDEGTLEDAIEDEPFRKDEMDSHLVWVKYFAGRVAPFASNILDKPIEMETSTLKVTDDREEDYNEDSKEDAKRDALSGFSES